jgi:hypothetical protein
MSLSRNVGGKDDVNKKVYKTKEFLIGSSSGEVECFTDATTKASRQWIRVVNKGPGKIEVGPQGEPKETLFKNQGKYWNHSADLPIYVEHVSGVDTTVFVEESG